MHIRVYGVDTLDGACGGEIGQQLPPQSRAAEWIGRRWLAGWLVHLHSRVERTRSCGEARVADLERLVHNKRLSALRLRIVGYSEDFGVGEL